MKSLPSGWKYSIGLIVSILLLFAANLWVGSVRIPAGAVWDILCGHAVLCCVEQPWLSRG